MEPESAPLSEADVYMEYRRCINAQSEELRAQGSEEVLAAYSEHLAAEGLSPEQVAARRQHLSNGTENQEVELWNRVLTSDEQRFNTDPNEFLVRMVEYRPAGRALDVGMGQGRNAIWLAAAGWEVTGFDPADRAVALAEELAVEAGVELTTEVIGSAGFHEDTTAVADFGRTETPVVRLLAMKPIE